MAFVQSSKSRSKVRTDALDPRTKLLLLLLASMLSFLIPNAIFLASLLGVMLITAAISRVNLKKFIRYVRPTIFLIPVIFLIQLIFNNSLSGKTIEIFVEFGFLTDFFRMNNQSILIGIDSLLIATSACLRILNLAIGSCLFSLTTNSNDYLQSLTKIGFPFELAFTTGLVIYFLPMVITETTETRMALETRGVSINKGRFRARVRAFRILATSILINFIEKSKYQAIALDSRGFKAKKNRTYYRSLKLRFVDVLVILLALGATAGVCYLFWTDLVAFFAAFGSGAS